MSKLKTVFQLETNDSGKLRLLDDKIKIIGGAPKNHVYVAIETNGLHYHFIQDKDLERFAVNILKALKSKKLK